MEPGQYNDMPSIVQRTFALAPNPDQGISLNNADMMRRLAIGTDWTRLRLGFNLGLSGTAGNSTAFFALGLCHGIVRGPSRIRTTGVDNFVGLINQAWPGGADTTTFTARAATPDQWVFTVGYGCGCYQGTTAVGRGTNQATPLWPRSDDPVVPGRWTVILEFSKGSPNYTMRFHWVTAASTDAYDLEHCQQMLQNTTFATGIGSISSTSQAFACNESTGGFDTVCAYWSGAGQTLEIFRIDAFRLA